MPKPKYLPIRHEKLGLSGTCLPEALPAWEANGWTAVEDGDVETDEGQDELDFSEETTNVSYYYDTNTEE